MKLCPMEAEMFHKDGQTDAQTEGETGKAYLMVTIRNFANLPKFVP